MIPLFLAVGSTVAACVGYVYFMVKKRQPKPETELPPPPPEEKPSLKMEDYEIA